MKFATFCSGIGAPESAWTKLGWESLFTSEIEPFPCAVLKHHYPEVPNLGNMEKITDETLDRFKPDVVCAGTPCQSFSIAGLRAGMADARGNLALVFLRHVSKLRPRWMVWENVPGVLSSWSDETYSDGERWQSNDFDTFLCGLRELGYGVAWRILNAEYFGVPQRRRRIFVVGYLGDWRRAAAVLFERHCLSGDSTPRREKGKDVAPTISARTKGGGGLGTDFDCDGGLIVNPEREISHCLNAGGMGRLDYETETLIPMTGSFFSSAETTAPLTQNPYADNESRESLLVAHALRAVGFDASEDGTGRGTPIVPVAFSCKDHGADAGEVSPTLRSMGHSGSHANAGGQLVVAIPGNVLHRGQNSGGNGIGADDSGVMYTLTKNDVHAVCFAQNTRDEVREMEVAGALAAEPGMKQQTYLRQEMAVRRLTPLECERLQGFPDLATKIHWSGWRKMGVDETPEICRAAGIEVRQSKSGAWRVRDVDGPRYKALGNSMAIPCLEWIGKRIQMVDEIK